MNSIFIWITLLLIIILGYSTQALIKTRKKSRFQARLAVYFYLFMLLPIIPLLFLFSSLIINSSNLIAPPEIDQALNRSLEILRQNLEQKGNTYFQSIQNLHDIQQNNLNNNQIDYFGSYSPSDSGLVLNQFLSNNPQIDKPLIQSRAIAKTLTHSGSNTSRIVEFNNENYFESYIHLPDSIIAFIGYKIDSQTLLSIQQINQLLKNYTSFSFFRDTVVQNHLVWFLALALMIILALISFQLAKAISGGISEPIRGLAKGMEQVGEGDLEHRVIIKAKDEIGFLIESFNNMTSELQISRENLKKAERAAAWRDVARQISHEIKNPLTPIELSLYRLKTAIPEGSEGYPDMIASVRIIEEEIASMRRLASSFSEFARMPQLELLKENIDELIKDCVALYQDYPIHYENNAVNQTLHLDREQIRRAINNLLKNAIEASPDKSPIRLELTNAESSDHSVRIIIQDQGTGIEKALLKKILKPYYTTKKEGSGLGLFIVNRIISEHGGKFIIDSEKGKGTTINIEL